MKTAGALLVAEWNSVVGAYRVVNQLLKTDGLELLELFSLGRESAFAVFQSSETFETLPASFLNSHGLRDCTLLNSGSRTQTMKAFYGLTGNVLSPAHSLGVITTSSVPLGFAIAHHFAQDLGPQCLLECKIGRGTGGGTQLFVGAELNLLRGTLEKTESSLLKSIYQREHPTTWDFAFVESPHPELRKFFSFENLNSK
jgi:hypothetical protein